MKQIAIISILISSLYLNCMEKEDPKNHLEEKTFTYLALGDSYTIGEGVDVKDRYPNQAIALLKTNGLTFDKPTIIAKTGWTTDELMQGISDAGISGNTYDLVTLLIGVNNQYRGREVENYKKEFRILLEDAITFAEGNPSHVVVLSIPDWGVTPFANARGTDKEKVAGEIDIYNLANKYIAKDLGVHYIEITQRYREIGALPEMVVEDKLHPSALVYGEWAKHLTEIVSSKMALR